MARKAFRRVADLQLLKDTKRRTQDHRIDVIVLHCYLDNVLEGLLRSALVRDRAVSEMFEPGRSLWAFTTKVNFAFALGLIDHVERDDLLTINRIRNKVAHNIESTSFRSKQVREWTDSILHGTVWRQVFPMYADSEPISRRGMKAMKAYNAPFVMGTVFLAGNLRKHWDIRRLAPPPSWADRKKPVQWPRLVRRSKPKSSR